ncbi:hypothetical protein GUJ93_ZPchr0013g34669 [Zizania palustris]|uniref:Protein TIFY n=1 Tax=Zizania palustris TaxID=103762 RepID=A0A8J6BZ22_ZIZPA|nr:hypothetical protein GUJ93_ZPchr0013g34669 [Zizania palustris]
MAMASKDHATRRFAVACGVLSQYVKAASQQSAPAAAAMAPRAPDVAAVQEGRPSDEPASGEEKQLTIFYAGRVLVIDRCTPAKAAELIRHAAAAHIGALEQPVLVDVPMARKASVQRFLSKRKHRATTPALPRAPYSGFMEEEPRAKKVKSAAGKRRQDWLALGSV